MRSELWDLFDEAMGMLRCSVLSKGVEALLRKGDRKIAGRVLSMGFGAVFREAPKGAFEKERYCPSPQCFCRIIRLIIGYRRRHSIAVGRSPFADRHWLIAIG